MWLRPFLTGRPRPLLWITCGALLSGAPASAQAVPAPALSGPALSGPTVPAPDATWRAYQVQRGDTLYSLTRKAALSERELKAANPQLTGLIAGQWLWMPAQAPLWAARTAPVTPESSVKIPLTAGPITAGPITAGPITAGPITAGPITAGPTAPAAPTISPLLANPALPQEWTVQAGDTLYSLARSAGVSAAALAALNGIDPAASLQVGQRLRRPGPGAASTPTGSPEAPPAASTALTAVPGATAARTEPTSGQSLQLTLPGGAPAEWSRAISPALPEWLRQSALWLGTPYVWGGAGPQGLDCSGLTLLSYRLAGIELPRVSSQQAQVGQPTQLVQPGDLLYFDTEGQGRVTHVGIALEGDAFLNANSYAGYVTVDSWKSSYWGPRLLGARRIL